MKNFKTRQIKLYFLFVSLSEVEATPSDSSVVEGEPVALGENSEASDPEDKLTSAAAEMETSSNKKKRKKRKNKKTTLKAD